MNAINPALITPLLQQSMAEGQSPTLTIVSNSMAPLLWRGDKIRIEAVQVDALQQGDVVLMQLPHTYMTHRFWGMLPDGSLLTRGDRPLYFDEAWQTNALIGRVVALHKHGKWFSLVTQHATLNSRLAKISCLETRLFAPPLPPQAPLPTPYKVSGLFQRFPLGQRILRRLLYYWAKILVCMAIR